MLNLQIQLRDTRKPACNCEDTIGNGHFPSRTQEHVSEKEKRKNWSVQKLTTHQCPTPLCRTRGKARAFFFFSKKEKLDGNILFLSIHIGGQSLLHFQLDHLCNLLCSRRLRILEEIVLLLIMYAFVQTKLDCD